MLAYFTIVDVYSTLSNYLAEPVFYIKIDAILYTVFM